MFNFELLSVIASIILVFGLGYFAKRIGIVKEEHASIINNVIIYLTLPAFIFRGIYRADLSPKLFYIPVIAIMTTSIVAGIAYLIGRLFRLDQQLLGTFMLACAVGNTGYIAYPLLLTFLGENGLVRGILYDMFGTVIFMLTIGLYICSIFGRCVEKPSITKQFFTFPPLYALVLAFMLRPFVIPEVVTRAIDLVANVTVGLILISIGIALAPAKGAKKYYPLLGLTLFMKLFFAPFIVLLLGKVFLLQGQSVTTTILDASMPTALLTLVFGIKYELNVDFLSSAIFILTIASVVTVPLVQLIFS